jgi:hypothetical protein
VHAQCHIPLKKVFVVLEDSLPGSLITGLSPISVPKTAVLYTSLEKYFTAFEMLN